MGIFSDILKSDESLFLNSIALDYDFQPKLVPFREDKQHHIASCIKPLFQNRTGKNLFITGNPGIGKTACIKHVLRELEEEHDNIYCIYVNCWKKDTPYKIITDICAQVGYSWIQNKRADELMASVAELINKKTAVIVLDEADKITDQSILYSLLEDIYRKTIILITNESAYLTKIDTRVKSRLMPDVLEFDPYTKSQTYDILSQRMKYAFVQGTFDLEAFDLIAQKTHELEDIRVGLFLLKESGDIAEVASSRRILTTHTIKALEKLIKFKSKDIDSFNQDNKKILNLIQQNSGKTIKELHDIYGSLSYRTFYRRVKDLSKNKMITLKDINKGAEGRSTLVEYSTIKSLKDYE